MTKRIIVIFLVLTALLQAGICYGEINKPEESRELQFQDMLMLFLLPYIDQQLPRIYAPLLTQTPQLYPYFVDVINVERVNGFRRFVFLITLEVVPTVGPHIPVGRDRFTFEISTDKVKLISVKHLKDPNKDDFPPNYLDILRN